MALTENEEKVIKALRLIALHGHDAEVRTTKNVCEFRVSKPKTEAGVRTIPIMEQLYQILLQERERQNEEGFCSNVVDGMTNFIFTNRFRNPHNPAAVNRAIKRMVDAHNAEEEIKLKSRRENR